jgi:hypothetical protein
MRNVHKVLRAKAKRNVLTDGQGARKRKPMESHRHPNQRRHMDAFADLRRRGVKASWSSK